MFRKFSWYQCYNKNNENSQWPSWRGDQRTRLPTDGLWFHFTLGRVSSSSSSDSLAPGSIQPQEKGTLNFLRKTNIEDRYCLLNLRCCDGLEKCENTNTSYTHGMQLPWDTTQGLGFLKKYKTEQEQNSWNWEQIMKDSRNEQVKYLDSINKYNKKKYRDPNLERKRWRTSKATSMKFLAQHEVSCTAWKDKRSFVISTDKDKERPVRGRIAVKLSWVCSTGW